MIENVFNWICFLWSTSPILKKNVATAFAQVYMCVLVVISGDVHVVGQKCMQKEWSKTYLTGYVFFDPLHQFSLQCRPLPIFCLCGRFDRFGLFVMSCFRLFRVDARFNKRLIQITIIGLELCDGPNLLLNWVSLSRGRNSSCADWALVLRRSQPHTGSKNIN